MRQDVKKRGSFNQNNVKKKEAAKFSFNGGSYDYEIVYSSRKTFAISISRDAKIVARAPKSMKKEAVESQMVRHVSEIMQMVEKTKKRKAALPIITVGKNDEIPCYNQTFRLIIQESIGREQVIESGNILEIRIRTQEKGYYERASLLLEKWYRQKAKSIFTTRVSYYSLRMNTSYEKIFIKEQKTCWGSCSSNRNLNFNWRLVLMPPEVLDYCVVHELAHLHEMNHSSAFWNHVKNEFPQYKNIRRFLKEEGIKYRIEHL